MSKADELKNLLNTTLKTPLAHLANDEVYKSGFWSTGYLPLDAALGGGWAKGRSGLIYGESATLKSLIGLSTAATVQKQGGTAALIDTEHAFDPEWATQLGVSVDDLIIIRPEIGEQAIDAMEVLVRNGIDYICFDSIATMLPRQEQQTQLSGKDNIQPARIAALMAVALRKLTSANEKTTILWISQMRDNIGAMAFAPKTNVTGGKAIHYYVSQSLVLKKTGKVYEDIVRWNGEKDVTDKQIVVQNFRAELVKSRFGQPFTLEHFNFDLNNANIDTVTYVIQQSIDLGFISKKGAWWTIVIADEDGVVLFEEKAGSKDKFRDMVIKNKELYLAMLKKVCEKHKLGWEIYA